MCQAEDGANGVDQENGDTIGHGNREQDTRTVGDQRIRLALLCDRVVGTHHHHFAAVHLSAASQCLDFDEADPAILAARETVAKMMSSAGHAVVLSSLVAQLLSRDSIYTSKLRRQGVDIFTEEDPNVLKGLFVRDVIDPRPDVSSHDTWSG